MLLYKRFKLSVLPLSVFCERKRIDFEHLRIVELNCEMSSRVFLLIFVVVAVGLSFFSEVHSLTSGGMQLWGKRQAEVSLFLVYF